VSPGAHQVHIGATAAMAMPWQSRAAIKLNTIHHHLPSPFAITICHLDQE
jgi:hypothetical protein